MIIVNLMCYYNLNFLFVSNTDYTFLNMPLTESDVRLWRKRKYAICPYGAFSSIEIELLLKRTWFVAELDVFTFSRGKCRNYASYHGPKSGSRYDHRFLNG